MIQQFAKLISICRVNYRKEAPGGPHHPQTNKRPLIYHEWLKMLYLLLYNILHKDESNYSLFSNRGIMVDVIANLQKSLGIGSSNFDLVT